ncbi:ATP-dependent DNA helicase PIF1, partial [Trachymyrmex cornetzi]
LLQKLEKTALMLFNNHVLFYYQYVDDLYAAVPSSEIHKFMECFNSFHRLQFTLEIGHDLLNFSDVLITIIGNQLNFDWYHKPTFSGRFLNFFQIIPSHKEMTNIDNIIRTNNIFAQSYRMMHEEIQAQQQIDNVCDLQLGFLKKKGIDRGRYNIQRVNKVAAVFSTTADGEIRETFVTIYNKSDKTLQQVNTMDPNVEPWIYPLYYPYGNQGWHDNLRCKNSNKRVSRTAYVKYRMAVRDNINIFIMGRRLFQQWLVDNYVKIEKDRINYCKQNQKQLRAESYQELIDYLANTANNNDAHIGKMIILPSTFIGSPRNMLQHYQDAMAIVRKYEKPDLFITMTCNPNWREIRENLLPNQQPADRPDICARVFNIKKNYLIDIIVRQKFFGEVLAYVYVIEFQKRGLPHIHLLVTLKQNYKILNPEAVDKFISAEIPNPDKNANLHNVVMKHMIHGPCGVWCLINNKCSKHFPKQFQSETIMDEDGYPQYRRRNDELFYERPGRYIVNNRYVVPYNLTLLLLFNSHINVEIVSSIRSVKYLYKYIYKGHDAASVIIGENIDKTIIHDEIRDFIEARYVGPVEACWRILRKPLQEKSHAIFRLPVHLPNEHSVIIDENINNGAIRSAVERMTMLLDYFELNTRDDEAKQYLYSDIPSHYVFKKVTINGKTINCWEKRQRYFNCIGRMYSVSPSQIELFHLRILLLHVKGAKNFQELRTVNNEVHQTFTAACLALGLIEDDNEWYRAMNEAKVWMMPRRLRNLFVRILIHCQPVYPKKLWDEFKRDMSEDYLRRYGLTMGIKKTYDYIVNLLQKEGSSITNFINTMAFTGIAATLLPNGRTVHKVFGLPVPLFADSTSNIKVQSKEANNLKLVDIFILDEAPMAPRYILEIMDRTLRDIMQNDLYFGGKIVLLGGDFRQLLPIKQRATRCEIINLSIKFSFLWKQFKIFSLTENVRTLPQEREFAQFLLNLGNGSLNDYSDNVHLPEKCIANANSDIIKDMYGDIIIHKKYKTIANHVILSARNADVDEINEKVVNLLDKTTERIYTSVDTLETSDNEDISEVIVTEYLNSLNPTCLPPHELRLRRYTVVMLIRNLNISEGLCNGTRLLILDLENNLLRCEILSGNKIGEIIFLNRITLYCENVYPFTFKRRQFPVKLAFVMTINKSQGQTFEKVAVDLRKNIFNHGQLYVALSRVRSWDSLKVYLGENNPNEVKNYVYKEVLE